MQGAGDRRRLEELGVEPERIVDLVADRHPVVSVAGAELTPELLDGLAGYAVPAAALGLMAAILFDPRIGVLMALVTAVLTANTTLKRLID